MKRERLYLLLFVGGIVMIQSCGSAKRERSKDLVVIGQTDSVCGVNEKNKHEWAEFTVDVPVNGPKALFDSVMAFVNKELYDACESCAHFDEKLKSFSKEEMFSDDGEHLFGNYMEKYRPLIQENLWKSFSLTLLMESQTEKFVTYGLEFYHCGAGCSSQKYYYTFDKSDGHQIKDIISHDNLVRFFTDYPEYSTFGEVAWSSTPEWKFSPEEGFDDSSFGLLDDRFFLVVSGYCNGYLLIDFPYSHIISYLSPEVQTLVEQLSKEEL